MIMRWLLLSICSILLTLVQVILSPVLALWSPRLPVWLSWFQTVDYDLMGDPGHYLRWLGKPAYLQRLAWLLRNPTDGFDYKFACVATSVQFRGDPATSNRPMHSGWCVARASSGEWMLYIICKWPFGGRCLRIYAGWKLMGLVHNSKGRYPIVFVINPFSG